MLPENEEAWVLWGSVSTQWRAGAFSIVGLDYPAVFQVAEFIGIELTPGLFLKLQLLEHKTIERTNKSREEVGKDG